MIDNIGIGAAIASPWYAADTGPQIASRMPV
jgi:hypothetical protein